MGVIQGTVTSSIERHVPVNELSALARVERPDLARPPLYLHKWWARRFGSVFRSIILAAFLWPCTTNSQGYSTPSGEVAR
jgi:adenine-specific DNA methylase